MTGLIAKIYVHRLSALTGRFSLLLGALLFHSAPTFSASIEFNLPIKCNMGIDCFLQQLPDTDPSKNVSDSFCGSASYDGHKGTDIRLITMEDVKRNVPVIASAEGIVKAIRDGERDNIVKSKTDRNAVKNKECGNGVVITHENGFETQYCHLKQGSISVSKGQRINLGQQLGVVGASGLAQFPHIHLTIRQNGKILDPFTGNSINEGCQSKVSHTTSLWSQKAHSTLMIETSQIIATGFSDKPVKHDNLVMRLPVNPTKSSAATVGWGYFINLRKGDRVSLSIYRPDGAVYSESTSKPLDRSKAAYSIFSGRKRKPAIGIYKVESAILRGNKKIATKTAKLKIN